MESGAGQSPANNQPEKIMKTTSAIHISLIRNGDTIIHNGVLKTVCNKDIKSGFCGITIFGDSFRMGTILVQKQVL